MRQIPSLFSFNRGIVSPLALARTDQKRIALSAETMNNWMCRSLGPMSLRPGWQYIGRSASDNAPRNIKFVFSTNDTAIVEFTNLAMRVWINDVVLTRPAVSSAVTNGTFSGNITGWTDSSDAGGAIAYQATNQLKITGNGTARGIAVQQVNVSAPDRTVEHALRIVVARGPVTFQVGITSIGESLVENTVLDTGTHSISFTPNASSFYIQFLSTAIYQVLVSNCTIEAAGVVSITSPYLTADLDNIRYDQSGDVVFISCKGYQQRKVERRGARPNARSWSLSKYYVDDGPFLTQNFTPTTLAASAVTGDITITASTSTFHSSHVEAIFSLVASAAQQTVTVSAQNTFTSTSIKVTGNGTQRALSVTITGTWVATVTVQQSVGVDGSWVDFASYTTNQAATSINDGLSNQIVYYRIGVKTGGYTSGTATCQLNYPNGSQTGVVRITGFTSDVSVSAKVLSALGSTTATSVWSEGKWSDKNGWPSAVALHEGRLWWAGGNSIDGTVSDDFYSFDIETLGDSGPIIRSIGSGPVDTISWLLSMQRLVIGAQGSEISARSSALDTPLTPVDFILKTVSTNGTASVDAVKIDQRGIFIDNTGTRVYQLDFDLKNYLYPDYAASDLTALNPELGNDNGTSGVNITRIAVQRKPDTRVHCIRSDGVALVFVNDFVEDVQCWLTQSTDGLIKDVVVLPGAVGSTEDQVYYSVQRTINGVSVMHLEKWAKEVECRGGTLNKQADAFVTVTNSSPSATLSGLGHLEAKSVIVWADGNDLSTGVGVNQTTYMVSGGAITVGSAVSTAIVGLPYKAQWKSTKLGLQTSANETMLNQQKRLSHIGLIAKWIHAKGIRFGPDFDSLNDLPGVERGATVVTNAVRDVYDEQEFPFPGTWETDLRLCIEAYAPRPATIMAVTVDMDIHS